MAMFKIALRIAFRSLVAGKVDLDDVLFAICLDSIGVASSSGEDSTENSLYVHVSRPPKEGQATFEFLKVS